MKPTTIKQDAEQCRNVLKYISKERILPYEKIIPPCTVINYRDVILARAYVLFQSVPSMLFVPLHFLEISLRNKLHESLVELYSNRRGITEDPNKWYRWMPSNRRTNKIVAKAESDAKLEVAGREIISGDIISRLTFGVWISILEEYPTNANHFYFWDKIKPELFPNANHNRRAIIKRLRDINIVRNRLFHYEPLWNKQTNTNIADDLRRIMDTILETISWISKDCHDFLADNMPLRGVFNDICNNLKQYISLI